MRAAFDDVLVEQLEDGIGNRVVCERAADEVMDEVNLDPIASRCGAHRCHRRPSSRLRTGV